MRTPYVLYLSKALRNLKLIRALRDNSKMEHHLNGDTTEIKACNLMTIDLSNPDIHQLVALIKQACMETGMFYVINHGISIEDMDKALKQSKKFFTMSMDEKMKLAGNKIFRGYKSPSTTEFLESFVTGVGTTDDPTNSWPSADILPGWKEFIRKYQLATFNVGREICKLIALALDLNIDFFDQSKFLGKDNESFSAFLRYGDEDIDSSKDKVRFFGHTDRGLITILATDHNLGLQVCVDKHAKAQVWENVLPMKGAFIVNVADTLERLSNNTFKSIMHRVEFSKYRYSIVLFLMPNNDCVVESVPSNKSEADLPKNPPIKFADFLSNPYENDTVKRIKGVQA